MNPFVIEGKIPNMMMPNGVDAMIELGADEQFRYEATFAFIQVFRIFYGHSASVREMSEWLGVATSAVHRRLGVLKNRGWITGETNRARTIRPAEFTLHGDTLTIIDAYRDYWARRLGDHEQHKKNNSRTR